MKCRLFMIVRMVACLLVAAMLSVCPVVGEEASSPTFEIGNTVFFGHYEQDNHIDNGVEPIEWMILDKQGDDILLLSKYVIDCKSYNDEKGETNWQSCSIRAWLNGEFLSSAFTEDEANCIIKTTIPNGTDEAPQKEKWNPATCGDTDDSVFLLSYQEYWKYLRNQSSTKGTEYANKHGAKGVFWDSNATQQTRSSGKNAKEVTRVFMDLDPLSSYATNKQGIRPAIWINVSDFDWEKDSYHMAQEAERLAEKGKYSEAIAILESLDNYADNLKKSADYRVMAGAAAFSSERYEDAVIWFEDAKQFIRENYEEEESEKLIGDYCINPQLLESRYQYAIECVEGGDTGKAIELLTIIGQYKDSMDLLRRCYDEANIQYSWLTLNRGSVVNTGLDNGYSGTNEIKEAGDPHASWCLGRFMMSGYTERTDDSGIPVFKKNPGDNLILWFDLEQNIDSLNNNQDLFIVSDDNGSDRQFQIKKSKEGFGKGTLLISHTDAKFSDTEPDVYRNYLEAVNGTGANTKVEINEEGIYEVALDYEIGQNKKIAMIPKTDYYNYRISFSFEVRNGSSMYFLYDTNSGSEIQDYSRVDKGFRIDLKNSHAIGMYAERYELNQKRNGLDTRSSEPVSDGDRFEKTGYYEITGTNTATKEKMTKHIFVGSEEDLALYKATGDERLANFE